MPAIYGHSCRPHYEMRFPDPETPPKVIHNRHGGPHVFRGLAVSLTRDRGDG